MHDAVYTQRQATRHTKMGLHGGGSEFSCRPSAVKRGFPRAYNGQHGRAEQPWVTLGEQKGILSATVDIRCFAVSRAIIHEGGQLRPQAT